jgi:hypothetical protein
VRLGDGRVFEGQLPAWRHRSIHLGVLHSDARGFLELTPGTRPPGGRLQLDRRTRPEHFLPAGASGQRDWREQALEHAAQIIAGRFARMTFREGPREECFAGVAPRVRREGAREDVQRCSWLWVDLDDPDRLDELDAFLAERPCHLLVQSAGSGGVHCYWRLDQPLSAGDQGAAAGQIERANLRLIAAVGADRQCRDRSRLLRLGGSQNHKSGRWARIERADLALAPYPVRELVGDLPDPRAQESRGPRAVEVDRDDPYRCIPAVEYMARIAGLQPDRAGFVRCPAADHCDEHPSCRVGGPDPTKWKCMSCEAAGTIYDLASAVLGGPCGRGQLHGEDYRAARELIVRTFGEL